MPNEGFLETSVGPLPGFADGGGSDDGAEGGAATGSPHEDAAAAADADDSSMVAGPASAAEAVDPSVDMESLLEAALLQALHKSVKDGDLPMAGSALWWALPLLWAGRWVLGEGDDVGRLRSALSGPIIDRAAASGVPATSLTLVSPPKKVPAHPAQPPTWKHSGCEENQAQENLNAAAGGSGAQGVLLVKNVLCTGMQLQLCTSWLADLQAPRTPAPPSKCPHP